MTFTDEKDYIMRAIKEMVRVLFSFMFEKNNSGEIVELDSEYEVSGMKLSALLEMIDKGEINEAENLLLEDIDYSEKEDVKAAALFYEYLSEKDEEFLTEHDFTKKEVLDGIKRLIKQAGYGNVIDIVEGIGL